MKKYNFDQIVNRRNTDSIKWNGKDNLLPMWVADMDFPVLHEITEAIKRKADINAYGYVDIPTEYFLRYKKWWKERHDVDIPLDAFIFSSGVICSIDSIFKHLLNKEDKVIVQSPVYPVFFSCIKNNGLEAVENKLICKGNKYEINWDELEKQLGNPSVKAFLLCNPQNPTGYLLSKEEINRIVKLCKKNDVLIISDEIHCDFVEEGYKYTSVLSTDEEYSRGIIALFSPGKAFNVASMHSSVAVIRDKELRERVQNGLYADDVGEGNYFSSTVAIAAYTYGAQYNDELNIYIKDNRELFAELLRQELPNLKLIESHSTYLGWIDISYYSNDSDSFVEELKEETGLWLSTGAPFKGDGNHFVRINFATSRNNVREGFNRLKSFLLFK